MSVIVHLHVSKCAGHSMVQLHVNHGSKLPERNLCGSDRDIECKPPPRTEDEMITYLDQLGDQGANFVSFEFSRPWIQKNHPRFKTVIVLRHPLDRIDSLGRSAKMTSEKLFEELKSASRMSFICLKAYKPKQIPAFSTFCYPFIFEKNY